MRGTAVSVVAVLAVALGQQTDECAPPPPGGGPRAHPRDCCNANGTLPDAVREAYVTCNQKYPRPPRPTGPPPAGPPPTPTPEMIANKSCKAQCVLEATNYVKNGVLDEAAFKANFVSANPGMTATMEAAKTKCLGTYKQNVDQTPGDCKSGAEPMMQCLMRENFYNCPKDYWTASQECEDLKAKLQKCPMMPMMMGGGHHKGPRRQGQ